MTSKVENKFVHWAFIAERALMKLSEMAKDHPELDYANGTGISSLEGACRWAALRIASVVKEVVR